MLKNSKGFTLIELLVVVAIIGILASVVLSSLNSARAKGVDAAIKGVLANSRGQAELFYDSSGQVYTNICTDPAGVGTFVLSAVQKLNPLSTTIGGNADDFVYDVSGGSAGAGVCHDSDVAWAAAVSLKGGGATGDAGWCVDSAGASKEVSSAALPLPAGATVCP